MTKKPNRWLVALVCLNAVLLTAVIITAVGLPKAHAQIRPFDYLMVPMAINESLDAVWVIDMGNQQMTSCIYNMSRNQVEFGQVISFAPQAFDYGQQTPYYNPQQGPYYRP